MIYGELLRRVETVAGCFHRLRIGPGSVVGVTLDDEVENLVGSLALLALGAGQISLSTHDTIEVRSRLARRVHVSHVAAADQEYALAGVTFVNWPSREPPAPSVQFLPTEESRAVLYLKTSGTTGDMNLIAFNESQISNQAERHREYAGERLLRLASIEHNNSKRHRLYCVWAGGANVFRPAGAFDVADFCRRHKTICLNISRMHASNLAASGRTEGLSRIKLRTGGSAVS